MQRDAGCDGLGHCVLLLASVNAQTRFVSLVRHKPDGATMLFAPGRNTLIRIKGTPAPICHCSIAPIGQPNNPSRATGSARKPKQRSCDGAPRISPIEWENVVPADPVSSPKLKSLRTELVTAQLPLRFVHALAPKAALICVALLVSHRRWASLTNGSFTRQGPCPSEAARAYRKSQEGGRNADKSPAWPRHARGDRENQRPH